MTEVTSAGQPGMTGVMPAGRTAVDLRIAWTASADTLRLNSRMNGNRCALHQFASSGQTGPGATARYNDVGQERLVGRSERPERLAGGRQRVMAAIEARLDKVPAMIVTDLENVGEAVVALSAHTLRGDNAPWEARQVDRQGGADDLDVDHLELDDDLTDFGDNVLPKLKPVQRMWDDVAGILEKLVALSSAKAFSRLPKELRGEILELAADAAGR